MRPRILLLVALSAVSPALLAPLSSVSRLSLGPEGDVHAWLVLGPLPNPGAPESAGQGLTTDFFAPASSEAQLKPVEGERVTHAAKALSWKLAVGSRAAGVDLVAATKHTGASVAYAYTALDAPQEQEVQILFGSDDGARLYVNGQRLYEKSVARGVKRDEEKVSVRLRKGSNDVLFKVEQGVHGWGLMARVVGGDGKPIPGLTQTLTLEPKAVAEDLGSSIVRSVRGQEGALDVDEGLTYVASRARIERWLSRFRREAEQPEKLDQALRSAQIALVRSASASELSAQLKAHRLAVEAAWSVSRAKLLAAAQNPEPLVRTDVQKEDFLKVLPGGRYFAHPNGKPFLPIGYNHNPDWTTLQVSDPDAEVYAPEETDKWFANLKAHGLNLVRLMIETPPSGNLEERIGVIEPEHMRWLDHIFLAARKHGIKLMITPYDTFWMNLRWETTTYNPALGRGGMVHERIGFITQPDARAAQKRRMRWLIDRYGNLGEVFCWEILNEADIWWGANAAQLTAWSRDMAEFVRSYQKAKWGREHMVTMSFAEPMPKGDLATLAFREPGYDLATSHLYIGIAKAPKTFADAIPAGLAIAQGVKHALSEIKDRRPYMDGENGPIDDWIEDPLLDNEVFHAMSWSHLAAGGAGSSLRWPYRGPHHLTAGMLEVLKRMRTFVDGVDWKKLAGDAEPVAVDAGTGTVVSFGTNKAAVLWATWKEGRIRNLTVQGRRYKLFDTRAGKWLTRGWAMGPATGLGTDSVAVFVER